MIHAYYDGSADETGTEFITLGGLSASKSTWPLIEEAWRVELAQLDIEEWHSSKERARWGRQNFAHAAHRLFHVLGRFRDARVFSYAVTVVLADYRQAKSEGAALDTPEKICVNWAFSTLVVPPADGLPIVLYFDRGEQFMKGIMRIWERARRGGRRYGWPGDVEEILPASRRRHAIQAADLISWSARRHQMSLTKDQQGDVGRVGAEELALHTIIATKHQAMIYDYPKLVALPDAYRRAIAKNQEPRQKS